MTRAQTTAYRLRWLILIVGLLAFGAGVWWIVGAPPFEHFGVAGTPGTFLPVNLGNDLDIPINGGVFLGVFLLMQWLFLRPGKGWSFRVTAIGRPMRSSVIAAAFMAMLLSVGLVLTLLEAMRQPTLQDSDDAYLAYMTFYWGVMILLWVGWAVVFWKHWQQGDRYTWMGRIVRGLVAGSVLELFLAAAVYAGNPHKENCYCGRGSYTGLVFGGTVLLWAFGPGIVLLFLREKYRRNKLMPACSTCGYNLTGNVSGVCSECGTPTEAIPRTALDLRHRIMSLPWGKVLPVWLLVVVLVTGLLGYVRMTEMWICSECCLRQYRVFHQFGLPFNGPVLFEMRGSTHTPSRLHWPLTQLLDPHGQCRHRWVPNGHNGTGLTGGVRGTGHDFCGSAVEYEPDFGQFVNDRPDVLTRIRISARQGESIQEWLSNEYDEWGESVDGESPGN